MRSSRATNRHTGPMSITGSKQSNRHAPVVASSCQRQRRLAVSTSSRRSKSVRALEASAATVSAPSAWHDQIARGAIAVDLLGSERRRRDFDRHA